MPSQIKNVMEQIEASVTLDSLETLLVPYSDPICQDGGPPAPMTTGSNDQQLKSDTIGYELPLADRQ